MIWAQRDGQPVTLGPGRRSRTSGNIAMKSSEASRLAGSGPASGPHGETAGARDDWNAPATMNSAPGSMRSEVPASPWRHPLRGSAHREYGAVTTFVGLYVVLLIVVPSRLVFAPLGSAGTPANILGLCLFIWWLCARVSGHLGVDTRLNVTTGALAFFAASVFASYAWGARSGWWAPEDVHQVTDPIYSYTVPRVEQVQAVMLTSADRGLITLFAWLGISLLVANGIRRVADVEFVISCLVVSAALISVIGIVQFQTGFNTARLFQIPGLTATVPFGDVLDRSVRRVSATAIHPIEFGVVLAAVLPLALHRALASSRHTALAWVCVVLIAAALPMSVSRSAFVCAGAGGAVLFLAWSPKMRLIGLAALPFLLLVFRAAVPGVLGTVGSLFTNVDTDPSVDGRVQDYAVALRIFTDSPVFGRGLYTFVPQYYRIMDNAVLVLLIETGVVGFAALSLVFLSALSNSARAWRGSLAFIDKHRAAALMASLVGSLVAFGTFDALGFNMAAGLTFLLIGLSAALRHSTSGAGAGAVACPG